MCRVALIAERSVAGARRNATLIVAPAHLVVGSVGVGVVGSGDVMVTARRVDGFFALRRVFVLLTLQTVVVSLSRTKGSEGHGAHTVDLGLFGSAVAMALPRSTVQGLWCSVLVLVFLVGIALLPGDWRGV